MHWEVNTLTVWSPAQWWCVSALNLPNRYSFTSCVDDRGATVRSIGVRAGSASNSLSSRSSSRQLCGAATATRCPALASQAPISASARTASTSCVRRMPCRFAKPASRSMNIRDGGRWRQSRRAAPFATDDWDLRRRNRELGRKLRHDMGRPRPRSATNPLSRRILPYPTIFSTSFIKSPHRASSLRGGELCPHRRRHADPKPVSSWPGSRHSPAQPVPGAGLGTVSWSLSAGRTDAWNLALGMTDRARPLDLRPCLIVARLWRNSRYASSKLIDVHAQLGQLQHTADALTMMRSAARAFYAGSSAARSRPDGLRSRSA